ncbi:MAG: lipopolysaccharide biosynthesis protein [Hyphomonadaceae bacterium]
MLWRHLFGYLPASLASGLASFAGVYVFTRLLGAADYGRYSLAQAAMNMIYTLVIVWAEAAAFRFAPEAQAAGRMPRHIRTMLAAALASGCLAALLLLGGLPVSDNAGFRMALAAGALGLILWPVVNLSQELNRARQRVGRYAAVRMVQDIGAFLLGVVFAWRFGWGAAAPLAGLAAILMVLAATEGGALLRASRGGHFDRSLIPKYFAYGYPIALALLLHIALDSGDRFLIAAYLGAEEVGVYVSGYGVADKTVGLMCLWAASAASPLMMRAFETGGGEALRETSARCAATLALIAAPAATGIALVARPLADIMIAEDMRERAATIMPWIAFSGLLSGFAMHYASEAFQLARRTGLRAALTMIPVVLNLVLNAILLPRIGLMGAVYATLACYVLALLLLGGVGRRLAPMSWPWGEFARIALACAGMAGAVMLIPAFGGWGELLLKAAIGAAVYAILAAALDAAETRKQLTAVFARSAPRA